MEPVNSGDGLVPWIAIAETKSSQKRNFNYTRSSAGPCHPAELLHMQGIVMIVDEPRYFGETRTIAIGDDTSGGWKRTTG